jgi:hypothetical protein
MAPDQQKNDQFVATLIGQLKLLNSRKEDLYKIEEAKELSQVSPLRKNVSKGIPNPNSNVGNPSLLTDSTSLKF